MCFRSCVGGRTATLTLRYPTVSFAFESGANTWAHACGADCDRAVAIALKADVTIAVVGDSLGTCGTPQCPAVPGSTLECPWSTPSG